LGIELKIDYRAPSKERLFLGSGWGIRDVRGPYVSGTAAEIVIESWALSKIAPSEIRLTLSMSNRADVDGLTLRIRGTLSHTQAILSKTKPTCIILTGISPNLARADVVLVLEPGFGNSSAPSSGTTDIVALDEIQITSLSPDSPGG
jgi:hypothetical protein